MLRLLPDIKHLTKINHEQYQMVNETHKTEDWLLPWLIYHRLTDISNAQDSCSPTYACSLVKSPQFLFFIRWYPHIDSWPRLMLTLHLSPPFSKDTKNSRESVMNNSNWYSSSSKRHKIFINVSHCLLSSLKNYLTFQRLFSAPKLFPRSEYNGEIKIYF